MIDYFWTGSKKGRGRAAKSIKLIEAMAEIAEECAPITVRGVCYKLFTRGLIASMGQGDIKATASRKASSATSQTPTSGSVARSVRRLSKNRWKRFSMHGGAPR